MPRRVVTTIPLHVACVEGSYEDVKLLTTRKNMNEKDHVGKTPLHYACEYSRENIAMFLIGQNVDVYTFDKKGNTPLDWSCIRYMDEVSEIIFEKYKELTDMDQYIHGVKTLACLEILLKHGVNIDSRDKDGFTVLEKRIKIDAVDDVLVLVDHADTDNVDVISFACKHGLDDMLKKLIKSGANPDPGSLFIACANGHLSMARVLLDMCDTSIVPRAIDISIKSGRWDVTKLLVERQVTYSHKTGVKLGGDPNSLNIALDECRYDIAVSLLKIGYSPDNMKDLEKIPLVIAVKRGSPRLVDLLLKSGADMKSRIPYCTGDTCLLKTAYDIGDVDIMEMLLINGYPQKRIRHGIKSACRKGDRLYLQIVLPYMTDESIDGDMIDSFICTVKYLSLELLQLVSSYVNTSVLKDKLLMECIFLKNSSSFYEGALMMIRAGADLKKAVALKTCNPNKKRSGVINRLMSEYNWSRRRDVILIRDRSTVPDILTDANDDIFRNIVSFV